MKKYVKTFKFRGKKYGIRKGSNLHAIGVLTGAFALALVTYLLLCVFVGIGNGLSL